MSLTTQAAASILGAARRVAVLTGAGISQESGIPTFRDAQTGHWSRYRPEDLASPEAYAKNPGLVWDWYAQRFAQIQDAQPNAAHLALAQLERRLEHGFVLATQNVDGLHQRAGNVRILELHGNITQARCETCKTTTPLTAGFVPPPICRTCAAQMRPNAVWFGESLPQKTWQAAWEAFSRCDVALVVGTSALVEPAASLGRIAKNAGAVLLEVNPKRTPLSAFADGHVRGNAAEVLPTLLSPLGASRP